MMRTPGMWASYFTDASECTKNKQTKKAVYTAPLNVLVGMHDNYNIKNL